MKNKVDQEKVFAIYDEARKTIYKAQQNGKTKSDVLNELYKKIKEIVDDEG